MINAVLGVYIPQSSSCISVGVNCTLSHLFWNCICIRARRSLENALVLVLNGACHVPNPGFCSDRNCVSEMRGMSGEGNGRQVGR